MKKIVALLVTLLSFTAFSADKTISVAATPIPHAEILEFIKPKLAEQGITLKVQVFNDYVQPNLQVANGKIDANFMQHKPYLDEINASRNLGLVSVANIHVEPFGIYSSKIKNLSELVQNATVAIPNDPTNGGRALLLLQQAGIIKLNADAGILVQVKDITENSKNLKFRELEAASLPRVLNQVDLALINTNYALVAGLNPTKDALFIEGAESPYANIVAVKAEKAEDELVKTLIQNLQSEEVAKFIQNKYQGAVIPAF